MNLSMPGYIQKVLLCFTDNTPPNRAQHYLILPLFVIYFILTLVDVLFSNALILLLFMNVLFASILLPLTIY